MDIKKYGFINAENAADDIIEAGRRMYERGFVAANDGNISARVGENEIIVTPAGVSKGYMKKDMLIKTDMSGNVLEGGMKPTSEFSMHLMAYAENPEIRSVCHAHPAAATAYAVAGVYLDLAVLPECVINLGEVPIAPYATPGTKEVAEKIAPYFKTHCAALLANHGAATWGADVLDAYFKLETLEHYCKIMIYANHILKKANRLSEEDVDRLLETREKLGIGIKCRPKTNKAAKKGIISYEDFLSGTEK